MATLAICIFAATAEAQTAIYTTGTTTLATNQTITGLLAARDQASVAIANNVLYTAGSVEVSGGYSYFSGSGTTLYNRATMTVGAGAVLTSNGSLTVGANVVSGGNQYPTGGSLVNAGTVFVNGSLQTLVGPSGTFASQSVIQNSGLLSLPANAYTAVVAGSESIPLSNFYNTGTVRFRNGAVPAAAVGSKTPLELLYSSGISNYYGSGVVEFAQPLVIDPAASVISITGINNYGGGTLIAPSINSFARINFDAGLIRLTGSGGASVGGATGLPLDFSFSSARRMEIAGAANALTVTPTATLSIRGFNVVTVAGGIVNNGQLTFGFEAFATNNLLESALVNNGTVTAIGRINAPVTNNALGLIRLGRTPIAGSTATTPGELRLFGVTTNAGTLSADDGRIELAGALVNTGQITAVAGELRTTSTVANNAGGRITTRDGTLRFDGGISNAGTVGVSFGSGDIFGNITNSTTGIVAVSGGADATFYGNIANAGRVSVSVGSRAVFFGDVSGSGQFAGGGSFFYEGNVRPGNSPGLIAVSGDVGLGAGSTLEIEIGGAARGTQYDAVDVSGLATLGGRLVVLDWNGFVPLPGQSFEVLRYATRSGSIDAVVNGIATRPGLSFTTIYAPGSLNLLAAATPGDANLDAAVNFDDLLALAQNYGIVGTRTWLTGDFTGDNSVNFDDLLALAQHYGTPASFAADWALAQSLVPEPGVAICALAAGGALRRRARRL